LADALELFGGRLGGGNIECAGHVLYACHEDPALDKGLSVFACHSDPDDASGRSGVRGGFWAEDLEYGGAFCEIEEASEGPRAGSELWGEKGLDLVEE
jgi:hypothetical protein